MKYVVRILFCILLFQFSISLLNSQVIESDYVRQSEVQEEVLGEEVEITQEEEMVDEVGQVDEDENSFVQDRIIELMAVIGGVVLVVLFAYIVYGNKVKK